MHRLVALLRAARVRLVDDDGVVQRMQVYEGDLGAYGGERVIDRVPAVGLFGLLSVPPLDAEVVLAAASGDRTHSVAIASNHRASRPTGFKPGDSGLYDVRGAKVTFTAAGVTVDAAGLPVLVTNASQLRCECDVVTTGDVIARADGQTISLTSLHDAYNQHRHGKVAAGSAASDLPDRTA